MFREQTSELEYQEIYIHRVGVPTVGHMFWNHGSNHRNQNLTLRQPPKTKGKKYLSLYSANE